VNSPTADPDHWLSYLAVNFVALEALSPYLKEGATVLDLGCGTGFTSTCLARMVGSAGRVVGLDLDRTKLASARQIVEEHFPDLDARITLQAGDAIGGYTNFAPYDGMFQACLSKSAALHSAVIHAGFCISGIPRAWREQLKMGGAVLCAMPKATQSTSELPHSLNLFVKADDENWIQTELLDVEFEEVRVAEPA